MRRLPANLRGRELRLISGLVMGLFVLCHFANHALGLISLEAMEAARPILAGPWRTKPGAVLLYGSVVLHFVLALRVLYNRRSLRMTGKEAGQTILGIALPFLLIGHVVGTRVEFAWTGVVSAYPSVVRDLWITAPGNGVQQAIALLVAWLHVALGVYFWFRPRPSFHRWRQLLFAFAVLLPVLSLLGFAQAGREARSLPPAEPPKAGAPRPAWIGPTLQIAFALPVLLVLAGRGVRAARARRSQIRIIYPGGRAVDVPKGFSVLEASRRGRIPHQAVCGGRARCSTCRVAVIHGASGQPRPEDMEQATLNRIRAGLNVRLACQFRPSHDIEVVPLVAEAAASDPAGASQAAARAFGRECTVAVLFCDLRGFTSFTERTLPFDVVFILNRYFEAVGSAVAFSGGVVDKFIGDGAMALFGLDVPPEEAARQATAAAGRIRAGLAEINAIYAAELPEPLRLVLAIHQGPAIVGEIGYGSACGVTAVGDTINVASRLEGLAKSSDAELVLSDDVARAAGLDLAGFDTETLSLRGRSQPMKVWLKRADRRRSSHRA